MALSIIICLGSFVWLVLLLRKDQVSLGLPVAYLFSLLLIHVPGAFANLVGASFLVNSDLTELAMHFTAVASVCFVIGVWRARCTTRLIATPRVEDHSQFWWFCLFGGWIVTYVLAPLMRIPSLGAALNKGAAIWILGVLLGLRWAFRRRDPKRILIWVAAMMIYPVIMLLLGGFLSYGSAAIIICCSVLSISTKGRTRVAVGIPVFTFVALSLFVSYYQHRSEIRREVWGGAPLRYRIEEASQVITDFQFINPNNETHVLALDARLNQNYFVGLAARRIDERHADYLLGRSVWEGLISLIPRYFWADKPVFAGSPKVVAEMTGLQLNTGTSFGVGNVMECQINFGMPGVIIGFLALGWCIGKLDRKAAMAEGRGDFGATILFFLPCVALIQPNGSLVELASGSAAALVGALGWKALWRQWSQRRGVNAQLTEKIHAALAESAAR